MTKARSQLLIFEPDPRGHTREWIGHLIAAAEAAAEGPGLILAVASELAMGLADAAARTQPGHVRIVALTPKEQALCTHRRLVISGFARWWFMRRYLRKTGADRGLFLEFDHLTLPLALGLGTGRKVSGVLFRPSVHYTLFRSARAGLKERVRDWRKAVLYRLMLLNPALDRVFSLDPYFPAFARRHYWKGKKVFSLPDPAFPSPGPAKAEDLRFLPPVPTGRKLFVLFGELTERKGVIPLLEALVLLPPETAGQTAVAVAGRVDPDLRPALHRGMDRLASANPSVWFHLEDRRLTEGEIVALLDRGDVVLAPYQRFVGSSGVLIWAAHMQRPVICQEYGLLGHLVRLYALGLTTDTSAPAALSSSISEAIRKGPDTLADPAWMAGFVGPRMPEHFAATLLNCPREHVGAQPDSPMSPNGHNPVRLGHTPGAEKSPKIGFLLRR